MARGLKSQRSDAIPFKKPTTAFVAWPNQQLNATSGNKIKDCYGITHQTILMGHGLKPGFYQLRHQVVREPGEVQTEPSGLNVHPQFPKGHESPQIGDCSRTCAQAQHEVQQMKQSNI